jgi:hypothetical protein
VDAETPQTTRRAPWQFSLRSLFLFTAAVAGTLSAVKMLGMAVWPSPALFVTALLLPVWLPLFFLPAESLRRRLRPLLALIPAGWYVLSVGWYTSAEPSVITVALGYVLSALALAFSARGRRQLINVPLWLALLASASAIFTR